MDNLTKEQRSFTMSHIKGKNTFPEILLRKAMYAKGIRYRCHAKNIYGKPDISIKKYKLAIFVDSEFWHGKDFLSGKIPLTNQEYWIHKLKNNIARDIEVTAKLRSQGWIVLRYWTQDINKNVEKIVDEIKQSISKRYN